MHVFCSMLRKTKNWILYNLGDRWSCCPMAASSKKCTSVFDGFTSLQSIPVLFIFTICFLMPISGYAQVVFSDTGQETPAEVSTEMCRKAFLLQKNRAGAQKNHRLDILEIEDRKYLLPDGFFDVYEWRDGQWVNLYQGAHAGYNYGSRKYIIGNSIYSFGGHGFWNTHGQIIQFDWKTGDWNLLPFTKDLPIGLSYLESASQNLYVFSEKGEFKISFKEKKVTESKTDLSIPLVLEMNAHADVHAFETDSMVLFIRSVPNMLIDKKTETVYIQEAIGNKMLRTMSFNYCVQIRGQEFRITDPGGGHTDTLTQEDIYQYFKGSEINTQKTASNRFPLSKGIAILVGLGAFAFLYFFRKRRNQTFSTPSVQTESPVIEALILLQGQTLTTEQLDEILGIQHIVPNETQRHKRAQFIKQINQSTASQLGKALIHRIQDPQDGRRFLYEIARLHEGNF